MPTSIVQKVLLLSNAAILLCLANLWFDVIFGKDGSGSSVKRSDIENLENIHVEEENGRILIRGRRMGSNRVDISRLIKGSWL